MFERARIEAENEAALGRLLALGLELAEHLQARALASETHAEEQSRTMAFARAARSVRQTVALRAKCVREAERSVRETESAAREAERARVEARRAVAKLHVERLIWTEREDDAEAERLVDELDDLLAEDAFAPDFASRELEPYLERLKFDLGLATSAHPGASRGPSRVAEPAPASSPDSAWIPAFAGTSGEGEVGTAGAATSGAGEASPPLEGDWSPPPRADSS